MPADLIPGFSTQDLEVEGVRIRVSTGGDGPPLLLLHGHPQPHVTWHKVAPRLAARFTVVAPDLRGDGDSANPEGGPAHVNYSKRTMAADQVAVMARLGHPRFAAMGHDRGARVLHRMALDHRDAVERLAHRGAELRRAGHLARKGPRRAWPAIDCGHLVQEEAPEALLEAVRDFFCRPIRQSRTYGRNEPCVS